MSRPKLRPDWELYQQTTTVGGIETMIWFNNVGFVTEVEARRNQHPPIG